MPSLNGILETSLYVGDLERSVRFYQRVMQLRRLAGDQRFCALQAGDRQVLLLFARGASIGTTTVSGGTIPGHDGSGQLHIAFAVSVEDRELWEKHLSQHQVTIESKVQWERGGQSIYFRDPDGHLLELVTPGCWPVY